MSAVLRAVHEALALVLPVDCGGCGIPGRSVCAECRRRLMVDPSRREVEGIPVLSASAYAAETAHLIGAVKDSGRVDGARALGDALRGRVEALLATCPEASGIGGPVLAVAIPGTRSAFRRRGYEPVRLIARSARIPVHPLLRLSRRVVDQASLTARERRVNRAGSLIATRDLTGVSVLLLDDVVTTGATLADAVRAVRAAGGTVLGAATVAATPLRRRDERDPRGSS